MRFLSVLALVGAIFCSAGPAPAQQSADDFSAARAVLSFRAWSSGDRGTAIIQALQGLPHNPDAADIARFDAAWNMLRLAVISRSARLPIEGGSATYGVVDGSGQVMATVASMRANDAPFIGLNLWDPQTGAHLAELLPFHELVHDVYDSGPPVFSPDGRWVTLTSSQSGQTHVFDVASRQSVAVFGTRTERRNGAPGSGIFSPASTVFLRIGGSLGGATLYDTATWQPIAELNLLDCQRPRGIPGGLGRDILLHVQTNCGDQRGHAIARLSELGQFDVLLDANRVPALAEDVFYITIDPTERHFLLRIFDLETGGMGSVVVDLSGRVLADLDWRAAADGEAEFTRDGEALAFVHPTGFFLTLGGVNFDGTPFVPRLEDLLPYQHRLFGPNGEDIHTLGSSAIVPSYAGHDWPDGPAFYAQVWSMMPQAARDAVNADRLAVE